MGRLVAQLPDMSPVEAEDIRQRVAAVVDEFLLERAIRLVEVVNDFPPISLPPTREVVT
jgi:hypothetical protein